jgi:hypothetical protein
VVCFRDKFVPSASFKLYVEPRAPAPTLFVTTLISSALLFATADIKVTPEPDTPLVRHPDSVPLHNPFEVIFPVLPFDRFANPFATADAVIAPEAVNVNPPIVIDSPAVML